MDKVIVYTDGLLSQAQQICTLLGYDAVLRANDILNDVSILENPLEIGVVSEPDGTGNPCFEHFSLIADVLSDPMFDRLQYFFTLLKADSQPAKALKFSDLLGLDANIATSYCSWFADESSIAENCETIKKDEIKIPPRMILGRRRYKSWLKGICNEQR